jgi:hypothetical protein
MVALAPLQLIDVSLTSPNHEEEKNVSMFFDFQ